MSLSMSLPSVHYGGASVPKVIQVKSPLGNELSEPVDFNMMFATSIGPTGQIPGYAAVCLDVCIYACIIKYPILLSM